jgi:hypothetical protein
MTGFGSPIAMIKVQSGPFNGGSLIEVTDLRVGPKEKRGDFHIK